jgi:SNF2 family DNA or RNA helicase
VHCTGKNLWCIEQESVIWMIASHIFVSPSITSPGGSSKLINSLGKTIESIAGAIIFDALAEIISPGGEQLPTVIVTPNAAVLEQWVQALRRNGVGADRIHRFDKRMTLGDIAHRNDFLLLVKSKLQTEMKAIFDGIVNKSHVPKSSALFPNISYKGLCKLHLHERVSKGKLDPDVIDRLASQSGKKEAFDDCLRRSFADICEKEELEKKFAFRTCIIDEAHFLKNNLAFWGIATLLLGAHSQRVLPLTGTPYNNKTADVAAIMAYIDPGLKFSYTDFWEKATSVKVHKRVREQLKDWTQKFLVRRSKESVLAGVLGAKIVEITTVRQHPDEVATQESYEAAMRNSLKAFSQLMNEGNTPLAMARKKKAFLVLMCLISCAVSHREMMACQGHFQCYRDPLTSSSSLLILICNLFLLLSSVVLQSIQ